MHKIITVIICSLLLVSSQAQTWEVDQALMKFNYENVPGPPPNGPLISQWEVGINNNFTNPDFFSIGIYKFVLDYIIKANALVINDDNLFVGMGTDDPEARLDVRHISNYGSEKPALNVGDWTGGGKGFLMVNKPEGDNNENVARFRDDGSTVVRINKKNFTYSMEVHGDMEAAGYYLSSDANFKTKIEDIPSSLATIRKLQPKTYEFKAALQQRRNLPDGQQFGLLAQEVKEVLPNLVKTYQDVDEDGEAIGEVHAVNYMGLIPILIGANQELDQKLTNAQEENKMLRARMDQIEQMLIDLQK